MRACLATTHHGLHCAHTHTASRMQPTAALPAQNAGAADMDLPAVQSMDWLFKKERIYLLAQFWQQVSDRDGAASVVFVYSNLVNGCV